MVTVQPLHCGTLTAGRDMFEQGGADDPIEVPVPAWLIRHPQGTVLFDTGMHTDLTAPSEFSDTVAMFFEVGLTPDELISARLRTAEIDPAEIDIVVLSHLHFDHTGGLDQIPDARVVIQREEWAAGGDDDLAAANSFRPDEYRLGHDIVTADGDHDLFGDSLVTCITTPGHTPGHQSLRVRLADREVVLAADCAYFTSTLDGGPLPPLGHDHELHAASLERLQSMRAAGSLVVPGHDAAAIDALPTILG